jgi:deazaflavin-dependent oxidoreductase (nitroreductase family)
VLKSPLHRLLSGGLLLITYRGRRTGRERTIPVMYAEEGDRLIVLVGDATAKQWWRNLRGGAPVELRLRGRLRCGRATVVAGGPAETGAMLSTYLTRFPRASRAASGKRVVIVAIDLDAEAEEPAARSAAGVAPGDRGRAGSRGDPGGPRGQRVANRLAAGPGTGAGSRLD